MIWVNKGKPADRRVRLVDVEYRSVSAWMQKREETVAEQVTHVQLCMYHFLHPKYTHTAYVLLFLLGNTSGTAISLPILICLPHHFSLSLLWLLPINLFLCHPSPLPLSHAEYHAIHQVMVHWLAIWSFPISCQESFDLAKCLDILYASEFYCACHEAEIYLHVDVSIGLKLSSFLPLLNKRLHMKHEVTMKAAVCYNILPFFFFSLLMDTLSLFCHWPPHFWWCKCHKQLMNAVFF